MCVIIFRILKYYQSAHINNIRRLFIYLKIYQIKIDRGKQRERERENEVYLFFSVLLVRKRICLLN